MTNKIKKVSESIKSKLNFDDYQPSDINTPEHKDAKTEEHKDVIPLKHPNKREPKVKRTFYLREEIAEKLDEFYAKRLSEKRMVDKSDIVTQALKNLFENEDADVNSF